MDYKKHWIFGILFTFVVMLSLNLGVNAYAKHTNSPVSMPFPFWEVSFWLKSIPIILFYSIFPDLDHRMSKITQLFYGTGILILISSAFLFYYPTEVSFQRMFLLGISIVLLTFVLNSYSHRGLTHTIWFGGLPLLLLLLLDAKPIFYLIGFLAYYSHLLADGYIFKITTRSTRGYW